MKTSLLSLVAILGLFVTTAVSAAPLAGPHYPSPRERARYEAAQREQARHIAMERARLADQRRAEQRRDAERARFEALHRHDQGRSYGYNHR
ncbi:hypothetical protein E4631_13065 [Hymenobacter sp. UV11]|uniref:hypothetical protein n=1 Tax=Hymenobacter sp. UV11 TaxID=1849735 RepID=UPI00105E7E88|nr:hypothetical protein [Hymenobacter sp. UV11]TDN38898.1 hypothetical protein A8B98_20540 [Hymenobacter sp. UV11]TFZ66020.1 hypothetical protein E4631_13065 [Hymenobacter sp. UV11]